MTHFDCDVLIIGAGIGGLSAGALLSKAGKRVIILEEGSRAGGRFASFERDGYVFESHCNIYNGFDSGGGFERVIHETGINISKIFLDPAWQVILPNHRVNFYSDPGALINEISREFPGDSKTAGDFFRKINEIENSFYEIYRTKNFISPHTLKEKYIYYREIDKKLKKNAGDFNAKGLDILQAYVQNAEFKKLLDMAVFYYSLCPLDECPLLLAAFILGIPKRKAAYLPKGMNSFIDSFIKIIEDGRGYIKYNSQTKKIKIESGKAVGAELSSGETIRAGDTICAVSGERFYKNLLAGYDIPEKIRQKINLTKSAYLPFSVFLGVNEEIIPQEMCDNVFLCTDYQKPIGNTHTLFINITPQNDDARAPQGRRAMTVTAYLPESEWRRDEFYASRKEKLKAEIMSRLSELLIFLDEGVEYQEAATPLTYREKGGTSWGGMETLGHTTDGFGLKGYSNYTPYKRLWHLGEDTFPGRGSDFQAICALNTVNSILS